MDTDRTRFRIAVEKALHKEGVLVGQWQNMPVLAQDVFQSMIGVGKRYPWTINEEKGVAYSYDVADYPVAQMLCDSYTYVHSIHPPNGLDRKSCDVECSGLDTHVRWTRRGPFVGRLLLLIAQHRNV